MYYDAGQEKETALFFGGGRGKAKKEGRGVV